MLNPLHVLQRARLVLQRDATLATVMHTLAELHGTRRLVEEADGGLSISVQQAAKRVGRWAGGIAEQCAPGDRVVIATPNGYEQFLLCLAASRAGAIPVPINPQMRPEEVAHVRRDCDAALLVHSPAEVDRKSGV